MKSKLMRLETKMQILIVLYNKYIIEVESKSKIKSKVKYSKELYIMKKVAVPILIKIIMMMII